MPKLYSTMAVDYQLQLKHRIAMSHFRTGPVVCQTPRSDRYKQWLASGMEKAYKAAVEGEMSIRRAAELYGVPKSTLQDRLTGKVQFGTLSGKTSTFQTLKK